MPWRHRIPKNYPRYPSGSPQTSILDFGVKKWVKVENAPLSELAASSFHALVMRVAPSGTRISP